MSTNLEEPTTMTDSRKRKFSQSEASSSKKTSSSSNNSSGVKSLTVSSFRDLERTFKNLTDSKKWKLEDGLTVEDILYEYATSRKIEK